MQLSTLRHLIGILVLSLMVIRLIRVILAVAKKQEKWTQLLFPTFVALEVVRLRLGTTSRLTNIVVMTSVEALLACGALIVVLRSNGASVLSTEQRLFSVIRMFLPAQLASMMAQELMVLAECIFFYKKPAIAQERQSKSFGYVQASPIRVLPAVLAVGCVPEILLSHFLLKGHAILANILLVAAIWSVLWATGMYIAMRNRPHVLSGETLKLRMGVRRWCDIPLSDVSALRLVDAYAPRYHAGDVGDFTIKHCQRVEICLSRPACVVTLDGKGSKVNRLWVTADDVGALSAALLPRVSG